MIAYIVSGLLTVAAPGVLTIDSPAEGAYVNTKTPTITGSGCVAAVTVLNGTIVLCTSQCSGSTYSCTLPQLPEGEFRITAKDQGSTSTVRRFIIDVTHPADIPSIWYPHQYVSLNRTTITLSGTCDVDVDREPYGVDVVVFEQNGAIPSLLCSDECYDHDVGTWTGNTTFQCTATFSPGTHTVYAQERDKAKNLGPQSSLVIFTIDITPPAAPTITSPASGALLKSPAVSIAGTCETGAQVKVYEGSNQCTATCTSGSFSCVLTFADGPHTITASQTDVAGNVSPVTQRSFTMDSPPAAPVIFFPADGALIRKSTVAIEGICEAGAKVKVSGESNQCISTCTSGGTFICALTFADGQHRVTAIQTDTTGNTGPASAERAFIVDGPPAAPIITYPAPGRFFSSATPSFSGTCEPGDTVFVLEGATPLCNAPCSSGSFGCACSSPLTEGTHTITATQRDSGGNLSPEATPVTFTIDTTTPGVPAITSPAPGSFVEFKTPTFIGTCETGDTVEILEGATVLCSAPCAADQTFICVSILLDDGPHTVTARQTDPAGHLGELTASLTFSSGMLPPPTVIPAAADGSTSTFSGTATAGSTVTVRVDGSQDPYCVAIADAQGNWSCTGSNELGMGSHTAIVTAKGSGSTTSPNSSEVSFTLTEKMIPLPPGSGGCSHVPGGALVGLVGGLYALTIRRRRA